MKTKRLLFLVIAICLASGVRAQFSSSENVYCYEYSYTSNDGIKSKKSNTYYYFVNFQNDMMGYTNASDIKYIRQKLVETPTYYEDRARKNLASNYSNWKSSPAGRPTMGAARATASIIKYNSQYSTGSKYTYRTLSKSAQHTTSMMDPYLMHNTWSAETWGSQCYSFSTDRSEMIIWKTSDPENRDYYKRIDASKLRPNTDFLK